MNDKSIDLEAVRRGDALLDEARQLQNEGHSLRQLNTLQIKRIMATRQTFSVSEAADITGYSEETIRRHIRDDKLKAAGGGKGRGPYRISKVEMEKWWRNLGGGELFSDSDEDTET